MKTRIIHTRIWKDNLLVTLPRHTRFLFIYLITCESNNICGIFELPDRNMMFDTGLNQSELTQAKEELKGKIIFYNGWVKIVNTEKYNNYVNNPKMEKAFEREMSVIPKEVIEYVDKYDTSIDTSIYTTNNHKSKIRNHKSEIKEEENLASIKCLTDKFCAKVSKNYKVPFQSVLKKKNDLILYCRSNGKKYKDYKATLQMWVRKDLK